LLNEFLKEHQAFLEEQHKVQQQEVTIAQLKSAVAHQQRETAVLTAQLEDQAAQIQKVSSQFEMRKDAPRVAATDPASLQCVVAGVPPAFK